MAVYVCPKCGTITAGTLRVSLCLNCNTKMDKCKDLPKKEKKK